MTVGGRWTAAVSPAEWMRLAMFAALLSLPLVSTLIAAFV